MLLEPSNNMQVWDNGTILFFYFSSVVLSQWLEWRSAFIITSIASHEQWIRINRRYISVIPDQVLTATAAIHSNLVGITDHNKHLLNSLIKL